MAGRKSSRHIVLVLGAGTLQEVLRKVNPHKQTARQLRQNVVKSKNKYTRKIKHKNDCISDI